MSGVEARLFMHAQPQPDPSPSTRPSRAEIVSELERIRSQLASVSRELEESHGLAMLGTLAAGIAHEFNNILTPALNAAEIALASPTDPSNTDRALERTRDAIVRACEVADAILAIAADEPGPIRFHVEPQGDPACRIEQAIEQAFQILGRDLRRHGIGVTTDIQSDCIAAIRPVALEQVLLNLLINATKAMPSGGRLKIIARNEKGAEHERRVVVELNDTGHGIPAERLDTIFDSFVSFGRAAEQGEGFGLGLMVCRRLVQHAGGSISVTSTVGEGTSFRIELPAACAAASRRCA